MEDGNWKIDSIDTGMMPEYEAFIAIQCYLETYDEYNDIDINEINATITDFDEESGTFRAEAVIKDVAGNDAIKVIADVSNYSAIDASVTRLREKDETLKRPDVLWRENYLDKMARAVIKYIEENEEYKNMNLDLDIKHVYTKVYDYDDATGTCSGHATIQRTDGNDALDWYIGVDLNTETVTSCQNHEEYLQNSAF